MKKILCIVGICLVLVLMTHQNISFTEDNGSTKSELFKNYPLKVVSNDKDKQGLAVITPNMIQKPDAPRKPITTYTKGTVEGVGIILIDVNENNMYDEVGTDLMVIADSSYAVPLSSVINIKNNLYNCNVEPNGQQISLKPYDGEFGVVDLFSQFKCEKPPLDMAILRSGNDIYIDAARNKKTTLPCGSYNLWLGYIQEDRNNQVAIKQAGMPTIEVTAKVDEATKQKVKNTIKWGAPFRIDFQCSADENKVKVSYSGMRVFGCAGEEYFNIKPPLFPAIEVKDAKGEVVAKGSFCVT
ncbi:MAG: hypothetical protein QME51_03480 [Planctomycetota bacterium]|nr:hypothetical protein [Planctomycetota bacterium]MDI6787411.1 hypothetical protein [Planctomycetota bacterium]